MSTCRCIWNKYNVYWSVICNLMACSHKVPKTRPVNKSVCACRRLVNHSQLQGYEHCVIFFVLIWKVMWGNVFDHRQARLTMTKIILQIDRSTVNKSKMKMWKSQNYHYKNNKNMCIHLTTQLLKLSINVLDSDTYVFITNFTICVLKFRTWVNSKCGAVSLVPEVSSVKSFQQHWFF